MKASFFKTALLLSLSTCVLYHTTADASGRQGKGQGQSAQEANRQQLQNKFFQAASKGQFGIVKNLLGSGQVDIDAKDLEHGRTALHWAVEGGHVDVVRALLNAEARQDLSDSDNKTPLDLAEATASDDPHYDPEIITLLEGDVSDPQGSAHGTRHVAGDPGASGGNAGGYGQYGGIEPTPPLGGTLPAWNPQNQKWISSTPSTNQWWFWDPSTRQWSSITDGAIFGGVTSGTGGGSPVSVGVNTGGSAPAKLSQTGGVTPSPTSPAPSTPLKAQRFLCVPEEQYHEGVLSTSLQPHAEKRAAPPPYTAPEILPKPPAPHETGRGSAASETSHTSDEAAKVKADEAKAKAEAAALAAANAEKERQRLAAAKAAAAQAVIRSTE